MDTKTEILDFINLNETTGALLLTGPWGCGKSYLLKNIIRDTNNETECAIAMVSLFGVDSILALNNKVKDEYLELNSGFLGKPARKVYKVLKKLSKESAEITAAALPESAVASAISTGVSSVMSFDPLSFVSVKKYVGVGNNKRMFVLIFDDLERCNIPTKDLLGAINDYTENKGIKTIVVADEEKLKTGEYKEFKEKLISRTVKLLPDYDKVIDGIVYNYAETCVGYNAFLKANIDVVKQIFGESKTENLRSLKSYLFDYERIYSAWKRSRLPFDAQPYIFYMFGALLFGVKQGIYTEGEYGYLFADTEMRKVYKNWDGRYKVDSMLSWIACGIWNEDAFIKEINFRFNEKKLTDGDRFLIYDFWGLEQNIVDNGLPLALEQAYNGLLKMDDLIDLLQKISALKRYKIPIKCEINYSKIEIGIEKRKSKILYSDVTEPHRNKYSELNQIEDAAHELYHKIERFDNEIIKLENKKAVISYLRGANEIQSYTLKGFVIGDLDDGLLELFVTKYFLSKNLIRRELASVLVHLGWNDNYYITTQERNTTIENFNKLKERIAENNRTELDYMAIAINNKFVSSIEETLRKLKGGNN